MPRAHMIGLTWMSRLKQHWVARHHGPGADLLAAALPRSPRSHLFEEEIRQLLYGRRRHFYRILFEVRNADQVVSILHVVHGAREHLRRGRPRRR
jgi:hypothetical protein